MSMDEFDWLVEQQDQEMIRDGSISPLTRAQIQARANGEPIPHLDVNSPEMQRLTAQLFRNVRKFRPGLSDEGSWDEEEDDEQ